MTDDGSKRSPSDEYCHLIRILLPGLADGSESVDTEVSAPTFILSLVLLGTGASTGTLRHFIPKEMPAENDLGIRM